MKKAINRWIAILGAAFASERNRERADRVIAWLAGASNHERSMNG